MYKVIGGFDREQAIISGEKLVDATISLMKVVFSIYPKPIDMPIKLDYNCGMLVRNMLVWAIFRFTHPEDIEIDMLDILMTQDSQAFLQSFICPCGSTVTDFKSYMGYFRKKHEDRVYHAWFFDVYSEFSLALMGKENCMYSVDNGVGSIQAHKVNEIFVKVWKRHVLDEFKEDKRAMETLKKLLIYARCLYKFKAGS